ncbi:ClpV1 family T6SS ATPase [Erwinia sp. OLTSP20]|uniref:type VI secretion system ATPase TssH n=1 Tax=unclassified Erwinia TaxID=2622719 RepID=UPI000C17A9DC|nr:MULTISPECIES: type VI secretion system ATPase TssH [unclassified Erwinia]PIJ48253.1 ClpV1 family T6SS ATPase [Erwinia sp. OAMSP11]PIJ68753.1 ClpV1 family T6SS ATPase [Erwinia sp. OLSSP12]PIJ78928.1 ClpV1 family T6SS ATPase [Erwinia sp. OLCASP19]PIJ79538.1 ClpV1 family T6SS ATPase [Erwinia sp. OLMTSP26]PIJ81496.1 ClpV1 family T6SS ATPase [Erwinia sp. OLMDSP33]
MNPHLKSVISKLNPLSRTALDCAINHAAARQHSEVGPQHLLLALLAQEKPLFDSLGLQAGLGLAGLFEVLNMQLEQIHTSSATMPVLSAELVDWIVDSWLLASAGWGQQQLCPAALISTLLDEDNHAYLSPQLRQALQCDRTQAKQQLQSHNTATPPYQRDESTSALAKYTRNLTEQARNGQLDPVLGRENEIRQLVDILLRRRQNNPILTGEPGVGKTALAEGLAMRIVAGNVPELLKSMEVMTLDLALLQAGASVRGEFEMRLQSLLKEVSSAAQPIILFIDEAHTLIGAGGAAGQNDAANLLKPALARGELRIIAATTWAEYKKYIEKDAALTRRFQVVRVDEPDITSATIMLRAMAGPIAQHHNILVLEEAIHAAVTLSSRYITGRQLPDKSVSLLDTACARVAASQSHIPKEIETITVQLAAIHRESVALKRENAAIALQQKLAQKAIDLQHQLEALEEEWLLQKALVQQLRSSIEPDDFIGARAALSARHQRHAMVFGCVDATCVADVVSDWTGIPLGRMLEKESRQLDALAERLAARVLGQQHALRQIAQHIRISRAGMGDPLKPTGVFLLAGPSGTGKTETAQALAELLFGGERSLVSINMTEYQEAHSVSGLKGSPPGYVGYGQGGVLTEAVRRNPYSVVLLDEVEKAHPDVMELFYQVFDKGTLEDAEGLQINFRNTLIIMTSNQGAAALCAAVEKGESHPDALDKLIRPQLEQVFSPALMGRLTLIPYLPLDADTLDAIIAIKLDRLCQRYQQVSEADVRPGWSPRVVNWIAERCQLKQSGARNIDQVLNQHLLPLLAGQIADNDRRAAVKIDVSKNGLTVRSKKNKS